MARTGRSRSAGPKNGSHHREIGAGQHRVHAGQRPRPRRIDARDPRVRIRRSQDPPVRHPGNLHVTQIPRLPRHLLPRIRAPHRLADDLERAPAPSAGFARAIARSARRGGRRQDGVDDLLVAGAATEVPAQRVSHALGRRRRLLRQERLGRQQHARRAEPALHRAAVDERLLQGVEPFPVGQPLDRRQLAAVGLDRQIRAGTHRRPVDQHRARPAHLHVARALRALELQAIAQDVEQQRLRTHVDLDGPAVEPEAEARRRSYGDDVHRARLRRHGPPLSAGRAARRPRVISRLYSADPWRSPTGSTAPAASAATSPAWRATSGDRHAAQPLLGRREPLRPRADASDGQPRVRHGLAAVARQRHRHAERRPLVDPELHVCADRAGGPRREPHGREQLVVVARGLVRAPDEFGERKLRSPRREPSRTTASKARKSVARSLCGSANARLPPTVPTLRTRMLATCRATPATSGHRSRTTAEPSTARWVAVAPMVRCPSSARISDDPGMRLTSTRLPTRSSPSFRTSRISVPPA